jgi:hypothetical protein
LHQKIASRGSPKSKVAISLREMILLPHSESTTNPLLNSQPQAPSFHGSLDAQNPAAEFCAPSIVPGETGNLHAKEDSRQAAANGSLADPKVVPLIPYLVEGTMFAQSLLISIITLLAASPTLSAAAYSDALIRGVPHVRQRPDFCGEACVEMVLRKLGKRGDQDYVFDTSGLDPALGRGCYTRELARAVRRIGFQPGDVFYSVDAARAAEELEEQWRAVHSDLLNGIPSIVCMHFDASPNTTEHFRLAVGYRAKTDEVYYLDPALAGDAYRHMKRDEFLALWPLKYEAAKWTVVRLRMEPGAIVEPATRSTNTTAELTNADYAQHVLALKKKLPDGFSLFIERPFVVVGNDSSEEVKARCEATVKWAVDLLKKDFFERDPDEIITIWLFKDDASYRKYTKSIWNYEPTTPYGYYTAKDHALVMNISTGGGTLVHEIVHPFVRGNFPKCPAWLNEGLGSLYEQSGERDGHIIGRVNWRLPGLQRAIKAGKLRSFKELTGTTEEEFYNDDEGVNYAQARYLCYYLQEQGKLVQFYHEFVSNQKSDPTGYQTLVKTLGESDMDAFQKKWQAFVMGLKFR